MSKIIKNIQWLVAATKKNLQKRRIKVTSLTSQETSSSFIHSSLELHHSSLKDVKYLLKFQRKFHVGRWCGGGKAILGKGILYKFNDSCI